MGTETLYMVEIDFWGWHLVEHIGKLNKGIKFHEIEHWLLVLDIFRFFKPSKRLCDAKYRPFAIVKIKIRGTYFGLGYH